MNLNEAKKELAKLQEMLEMSVGTKVIRISDTTIKVFKHFTTGWDEAGIYYADREAALVRDADGKLVENYMIKERST